MSPIYFRFLSLTWHWVSLIISTCIKQQQNPQRMKIWHIIARKYHRSLSFIVITLTLGLLRSRISIKKHPYLKFCNVHKQMFIILSRAAHFVIVRTLYPFQGFNVPSPAFLLTHWGRGKIDAISQTTFSSAFSWMKIFAFRLKFHWSLFLRVQLSIFQHWFRWWLGAVQATSHYLNQWWLVYRRIYASLGLNELINCAVHPAHL